MMSRTSNPGFAAASQRLQELGFSKRAGFIFTRNLTDDVIGWLGLNTASRHAPVGVREVNPVVGVRHQGIERMVAELRKEKFHPYIPPTVCTPLGYIMTEPRYRAWMIETPRSDQNSIADLTSAVRQYALPFMEAHASLAGVIALIEARKGYDHVLAYRRPVAWALADEVGRALSVIDAEEEELANRSDVAADELRSFIVEFRKKYAS